MNTAGADVPLTMDVIMEAIKKLEEIPCAYKEFMITEGFDPDDNCLLLLPIECKSMVGSLPPYVKITPTVAEPTLLRGPSFNFPMTSLKL